MTNLKKLGWILQDEQIVTYLPYILHYLNGMCTVKTRYQQYQVADQARLGCAVCVTGQEFRYIQCNL